MMVKYKCNLCFNEIKKIFNNPQEQAGYLKCFCGGVLERQLPDVSTSSIEIVDNGNMTKRVELRKDIANRLRERGDKYSEMIESRDKPTEKK
jgi:hypothetical protein